MKFKQLLCAFLSTAVLLGCFSAVPAFAAEETEEPFVYLRGDVNLDGVVNVEDATALQRVIAELDTLSGLQQVMADLTGSGYDINTVTKIQQYTAEMDSAAPVGEVIEEGDDGIVYTELRDLVFEAGNDIAQLRLPVTFSTKYPDVVFADGEVLAFGYTSLTHLPYDQMVVNADETSYSLTMLGRGTMTWDYAGQYIEFDNYDAYVNGRGTKPFEERINSFRVGDNVFSEHTEDEYYVNGSPVRLDCAFDKVPMIRDRANKLYLPLTVISNLVFEPMSFMMMYNGTSCYLLQSDRFFDSKDELTDIAKKFYGEAPKRERLSDALTQVNYYSLCMALEVRYGLKKQHGIDDYDSYFARNGLKEEFLSGDPLRIENANSTMIYKMFQDYHSKFIAPGAFIEDPQSFKGKNFLNPNMIAADREDASHTAKRSEVLGENVAPYERRGDTVFITFDGFNFTDAAHLYAEDYQPDFSNTIDLFAYALHRLQNEDSDVKNVVVDLSCNYGGAVDAAAFVIDSLIGECAINNYNPVTGALRCSRMRYDLNLDGVIDENDKSVRELGMNVAIITTSSSFSSGNLVPCITKALNNNVMILGQQSGGGACAVGFMSTAAGSQIRISSNMMAVTMKLGYIRDVDNGVAPDVFLSNNKIFDRDYIVTLLDASY